MLKWLRRTISRVRQKGGIIGTTFDDLWFFKSSRRFKQDYHLTNRYTASVWAYRSIVKIAENIASVPLVLRRKDDEEAEVRDPRWLRLFRRPNPDYSFRELLKRTAMLLDTYGDAFWYLERDSSSQIPRSIRLLHPRHMRPVTDDDGEVTAWVYKEKESLMPWELVHFRYWNPIHHIWGLSPLEAVALSVEQDYLAGVFNRNFFENGAAISGFLVAPDPLTTEQYRRIKEQFQEQYAGVGKAHKIAILEGGMDFKEAKITQRDMQFVDMKKITREEIFAAFGTNPVVLGIYEDVKSYEGIKTAHKAFWQETIIPRLKLMEDTIYHSMIEGTGQNIIAQFDTGNVEALQEDYRKKVETAEILWRMGVPLNELNRRLELGLDEVDWGDAWWASPTLVPIAEPTKAEKQGMTSTPTSPPSHPPPTTEVRVAPDIREEVHRLRRWENFTTQVYDPLERKWEKKIKRYFYEQRSRVLRSLANLPSEKSLIRKDYIDLLLHWEDELKDLRELMTRLYQQAVEWSEKYSTAELGMVTPSMYEPLRLEEIGELNMRIKTIPQQILNTIRTDLKRAITEGLVNGESISQIQQRVRKVYNMASSRALTIARTETVAGVMSGRMKVFERAGIEKVMWVTAKDEHVRDSHVRLDGTIQLRGKPFPNGCRYPGDPNAPAGEVINCRCVLLPVLKDFIFTGGEPIAEASPSFAEWRQVMSEGALKVFTEHADDYDVFSYAQRLSERDPQLMRVYTRLIPVRISMANISAKASAQYNTATGEITFNRNIEWKKLGGARTFSVFIHELTHYAQFKTRQGFVELGEMRSPLMRNERFLNELEDVLEEVGVHDGVIEDVLSEMRDPNKKLMWGFLALEADRKWMRAWKDSVYHYDEYIERKFSYAHSNPMEFQPVLMELRAYGQIKQGSPLWRLTEAILRAIDEEVLE